MIAGTSAAVDLGPVGALDGRDMVRMAPDGWPPLLVYRIDGEIYATSDTCTHATASLSEGELEGHTIVCPVHWAEFDVRTGRPLCFPATRPLETFAVTVEDGRIHVHRKSNGNGGDER
ncbi:non-heme iron oxygenase ferredoxin subunit [Actinomadura rupiterrae]|uniref:non-heme iron oxygenase ferredoxin subunit n=1 Tax=Actinomadura rupiterrae TaxID=559627 RepID=UPI0020A4B0D7|nr:non-heme iron oxygenase ferredoxin subunit [Actinomadura rupiterrae]MCP2338682.1 nitrite reductase/ring-hydroxylating ferredoxin subunit [Actinomadura rupiterrae]